MVNYIDTSRYFRVHIQIFTFIKSTVFKVNDFTHKIYACLGIIAKTVLLNVSEV